jgi:hypothetical protein
VLELNNLIFEAENKVDSTRIAMNNLESQLNMLDPDDLDYNSIQS